MKIIIIGGTSNVGKSLRRSFAESHEVITIGRKNCDILLDLNLSMDDFSFPAGVDVVIHTASQFGVKSNREILDTESVNVLGTLKICQEAAQSGAKHVIFISSVYSSLSISSQHYNFYSLSKKHAEEVATLYCSLKNLPLTILKPSPLYGTEEDFERHQPFFYSIIDRARKGDDIIIFGKKDALRNYLYVDDLVEIIRRVIEQKIVGKFNCTYTQDVHISQIVSAAVKAFDSKSKSFFNSDMPDIQDNVFEKDFLLYELIGFTPKVGIEEGMARIAKRSSIND